MSFSTKRILVLICDGFIAVFTALSFFRVRELLQVDKLYAALLLFSIMGRLALEFLVRTVEEKYYSTVQQGMHIEAQHHVDRLRLISEKSRDSLKRGDMEGFVKYEELLKQHGSR